MKNSKKKIVRYLYSQNFTQGGIMKINNQSGQNNKQSFKAFIRPSNLSKGQKKAMEIAEAHLGEMARDFDIRPEKIVQVIHPSRASRFFPGTPEGEKRADEFIGHALTYEPPVRHTKIWKFKVNISRAGQKPADTYKASHVVSTEGFSLSIPLFNESGKPISSKKLASSIENASKEALEGYLKTLGLKKPARKKVFGLAKKYLSVDKWQKAAEFAKQHFYVSC